MYKKRVLVGDIHDDTYLLPSFRYEFSEADEIIIVGDVAVGFSRERDDMLLRYGSSVRDGPRLRFIRGNHQSLEASRRFTDPGLEFIEDGTIEDGILYIGGAYSVNKDYLIPGKDWWYDEELSSRWWEEFLGSFDGTGIHTVVSHDCPYRVIPHFGYNKIIESETTKWLDVLADLLPDASMWVFGHHHQKLEVTIGNIHYKCLSIAEPFRLY